MKKKKDFEKQKLIEDMKKCSMKEYLGRSFSLQNKYKSS